MQWTPKFQYASRSDTGMKRLNNEDCYALTLCPDDSQWFSRGHLFVVADGMGGHEVGELASKTAIDTLPHVYYKSAHEQPADALHEAMREANSAIYEIGNHNRDFKRMGTTCSSLVICADGYLVGHVGDSRVYRVRDERIDQLSFDHTVAWEQKLRQRRNAQLENVDTEKYGHVLTRCLGPDPTVRVDIEGPFQYLPGDVFVLCSDGLTKYLSDIEIGVYAKNMPPSEAAKLLVNMANLRGGGDNCTVVIVRVSKQDGVVNLPITAEYQQISTYSKWAQPLLFLATFICGIGAGVLSYFQLAIPAAMLGFLATGLLLWGFLIGRQRQQFAEADNDLDSPDEASATVFFRPYRTAAIRLSLSTADKLRESATKLEATAKEGKWQCNWSNYEATVQQAEAAMHAKKYRQALLDWSKAIDILFSGMSR